MISADAPPAVSRLTSPDRFAMECEALRYVRDVMGPTIVKIMIPLVCTLTKPKV
jgi:phosphoenolpyruvate synthase/pyruvate phosphate dikinase